ncbi:MAG: TraR/DksA C4-type zinc finger protein [Chloroflexota bacterium]|nr:TraR/DksA C4-type zinc finger protein [Chloroflexota bacterium]
MPFSYERAKRELLEEQVKLGKQLQRLQSAEYESVGYSNHMADDGTDAFDQAVGVALKRKVEASLEEIERALAKFDNGTYGICEACGARIDRARLEVLPQAVHCLDCQSRYEHSGTRAVSR